jgi:hypothetical protein
MIFLFPSHLLKLIKLWRTYPLTRLVDLMVYLDYSSKLAGPFVKSEFSRSCQEFLEGSVNLQSINDAIITVIPKLNLREDPNDYRPVSTHLTRIVDMCGIKIVTMDSNGRALGELESGDPGIKGSMDRPNIAKIAWIIARVWLDRLCG